MICLLFRHLVEHLEAKSNLFRILIGAGAMSLERIAVVLNLQVFSVFLLQMA